MEIEVTTKIQQLKKGTLITTIPKTLVDQFKLKKGDILIWDAENSKIIVKKKK